MICNLCKTDVLFVHSNGLCNSCNGTTGRVDVDSKREPTRRLGRKRRKAAAKSSMPFGTCPRCGRLHSVRNGKIVWHRGHRIGEDVCLGVGRKPRKEKK